jgi:small membrane protein
LCLIIGLLAYDFATLRKYRRLLMLEAFAFTIGAIFVAFPAVSTRLAHAVGIGRGVDFILYPLVIWLVRESFVARRKRLEDEERITALVRALAIRDAAQLPSAKASSAAES